MRKLSRMTAVAIVLALLLSLIGCSSSADKKTHLTFQIWDVYQRPGMQAMCDAYMAKHPDVVIDVQATSWSEYWTKLEARNCFLALYLSKCLCQARFLLFRSIRWLLRWGWLIQSLLWFSRAWSVLLAYFSCVRRI